MTLLHRLRASMRWLVNRTKAEQDLNDELEAFVDMAATDNERGGVPPAEARRLAVLQLGGIEQVKERVRTVHHGWWLDELGKDVRYAGRLLRRRPVLSASAVLTLMLGIGGITAVFGLLNALLLKDLPVAKPHELVRLVERRPDGTVAEAFTLITHETLQRSSALSGVIASSQMSSRPGEIEVGGQIARAYVQLVSDNYFDVLGVPAFQGRLFQHREPGTPGEPIAVISHEYWQRHFASDASTLGRTFRFGTREFTIAGITPAGFRGTEIDIPVDVWLPIEQVVAPTAPDRTRGRWMRVMGRLRSGVVPAQAEAEASALLGLVVHVQPGGIGYSNLRFQLYQPLVLVALVVSVVLLIACANLANLMLAATASRGREIAVRGAIGASRARIVRQLLTENLLLALLGGMLGLGMALFLNGALLAFLPPQQALAVPNLRLEIDARVLGFVILTSCGTCLLFGVWPALRGTGDLAAGALKTGAGAGRRHRSLLSRTLLVGQVVMCTGLLVLAAGFVRSLTNLRGQEAGYREDALLVADLEFPRAYSEGSRDQLIQELHGRASGLPGVEVAAFSHVGQLSGGAIEYRIGLPGRSPAESEVTIIEQRISPGFLSAMGTPLLAGREFRSSDDERAPLVAIVNESFVRRFLPGTQPLLARFFRDGGSQSGELMEIVGVVKDSKWLNLRDESAPMYYRPYRQMGGTPMVRFAIRTAGDPALVARELLAVAQSIDKQMVLSNVVPFREIVNRTLVIERLVSHVSSWFGVLALTIASVGLYGVLAYSVAQRRREIGLRIAVGAQPRNVEGMFLGESMRLLALGVAIGIPVGIVVTRLASSMLFGISPHDAASIGAALAAVTLTTLAAAYVPARAAARTDPVIALREE